MKIAIRMDDITPDMDWERFLAVKEILDQYGVKPLIGVVPDNQDENLHRAKEAGDFWEYIKELQESGWTIAMHGYRHVYTTAKGGLFPLNDFSEFAGLPYDKQEEMIKNGRAILHRNGIDTDIFMAPAHSYDKNTLKALRTQGFSKITDGFGKCPYMWKGMTFFPISFHLGKSLKKKTGFTTMVIHANSLTEEDLNRYRKIFETHEKDFISYHCYLNTDSKRRSFFGHFREAFLARLKHNLVKLKEKST